MKITHKETFLRGKGNPLLFEYKLLCIQLNWKSTHCALQTSGRAGVEFIRD